MKREDICIYTDKYIGFEALVPETSEEYSVGFSFRKDPPSEHFGMLYYIPERTEARFFTKDTPWAVDYIFIDWAGNIIKISTAKPFSEEIHSAPNTHAVLEIKGGECKRLDIKQGDTVYYSDTKFHCDNQYLYDQHLLKKISFRNKDELKYKDICFVALAELGAMGWAGSMQFLGIHKNNIVGYMAEKSALDYFKLVDLIFPPLKDFSCGIANIGTSMKHPDWKTIYMGFGNHLFIRKDLYDEFMKKITTKTKKTAPSYIYQNWMSVAFKMLGQKLKESDQKEDKDTFGYTTDNPVPMSSVSDEYYLLGHLRYKDGCVLGINRMGSFNSKTTKNVVDGWSIIVGTKRGKKEIKMYFDPYAYGKPWHMPHFRYTRMPEGFFFTERG